MKTELLEWGASKIQRASHSEVWISAKENERNKNVASEKKMLQCEY